MKSLELAREDFIGARSQQQDRAAVDVIDETRGGILILADGLGGHEGGAQASAIVEQTFLEAAKKGAFDDPGRRRTALRDALEAANKTIGSGVDPAHGHRGMASTAVVAIVAEGNVTWISIGDSHLYVWRAGKLTKLNEDHSQAGLMIRSGQYKETDPEVLAAKSVLVSALTGRKLEIVDHPQNAAQLEAGDVLILASDGLNTISEREIADIVSKGGGQDAKLLCKALIEAVKERKADRQDNTTVAIARVLQVPKRQPNDTAVPLAPPPRQVITTPTELPSARVETQIPVKPKTPERAAPGEAATQRTAIPTDNTVRSVPILAPRPSSPDARTAIPTAADARTAIPPADARTALPGSSRAPAPELQSTRPMAPQDDDKRKPVPLVGIAMLALATLFLALAIYFYMAEPQLFRTEPVQPTKVTPNGKKAAPTGEQPAPPAKTKLPETTPVQPPKQEQPPTTPPTSPPTTPPKATPTPPPTTAPPPSTGTPPEQEGRPSEPGQSPKPPGQGQPPPPQGPRTQVPNQPPATPPQSVQPAPERPKVLPPLPPTEPIRPAPTTPDIPPDRSGALPGAPTAPRALTPEERRERARIEDQRLREEFQRRQETIRDREAAEQERLFRERERFERERAGLPGPPQRRVDAPCKPDPRNGQSYPSIDACYQACEELSQRIQPRDRSVARGQCFDYCNSQCGGQ